MQTLKEALQKKDGVFICGIHIKKDAFHVGILLSYQSSHIIFHFLDGNNIPAVKPNDKTFKNYYFNHVKDFPIELIPSMIALAKSISKNKINNFQFNRQGSIYDGGKFEFNTGNYNVPAYKKFVNCAVFIIAFLNTYDYRLIDWVSWPNQIETKYLDIWLNSNKVPKKEWKNYYNQVKQIRGKHILVAPSTLSIPSSFCETERKATQWIKSIPTYTARL